MRFKVCMLLQINRLRHEKIVAELAESVLQKMLIKVLYISSSEIDEVLVE